MNPQAPEYEQKGNVLNLIREGMEVYDRNDKEIGKVEGVYLGEVTEAENEMGEGAATADEYEMPPDDTLLTDLARAIAPEDEIPDELRERLRREGFVRIDGAGIFNADRYVLPEQIKAVSGNRVLLRTTYDKLIKR